MYSSMCNKYRTMLRKAAAIPLGARGEVPGTHTLGIRLFLRQLRQEITTKALPAPWVLTSYLDGERVSLPWQANILLSPGQLNLVSCTNYQYDVSVMICSLC